MLRSRPARICPSFRVTAYEGTNRTARALRARWADQPFTLEEAREVFPDSHHLRQAVRSGVVRRIRRGLYAVVDPAHRDPTASNALAVMGMAISRLRDRGTEPVVAGGAAASIWQLDSLGRPCPPILLVDPASGARPGVRSGVLIRHCDVPPDQVMPGPRGWTITTPLRTGIDCARGRDRLEAFLVLNSSLRRTLSMTDGLVDGVLSPHDVTELARDSSTRAWLDAQLRATLSGCTGHGLRSVRAVLYLLEPLLETALEGLSWWRFDEAKCEMPTPQEWVQGASNQWYRVDFGFTKVIGEADGAMKYDTVVNLREEKRRQTDIELRDRPITRWGWEDMWRQPARVIEALRRYR